MGRGNGVDAGEPAFATGRFFSEQVALPRFVGDDFSRAGDFEAFGSSLMGFHFSSHILSLLFWGLKSYRFGVHLSEYLFPDVRVGENAA